MIPIATINISLIKFITPIFKLLFDKVKYFILNIDLIYEVFSLKHFLISC